MKTLMEIFGGLDGGAWLCQRQHPNTKPTGFRRRLCYARQSAAVPKAALRNAARSFLFATSAVALLAATGCGFLGSTGNEENGHEEPGLAEYVVLVHPPSIDSDLRLEHGLIVSEIPTLWAVCLGPYPPPDCGRHNPRWGFTKAANFQGRVEVANPNISVTKATIFFDADAYLSKSRVNSLTTRNDDRSWVQFVPGSVPRDVALRRRSGRVDLYLALPTPVPKEQEQPATETSWRVFPPAQEIRLISDRVVLTLQPRFTYKGPATTISAITLSGSAGRFTVISPTVGTALVDGARIPVTVQFQADALDLSRYEAFLTISTANAKHNGVALTGQRERPP